MAFLGRYLWQMIKRMGLFCVLATLLAGCGEQKTSLETSIYDASDSATIHKSCPQADFHKNVFEKNNLLHILSCLGMDKNHPVVFENIAVMDDEGFSVISNVLNKAFFSDTAARDEFVLFLRRNLNQKKRKEVLRIAGDFVSIAQEFKIFESALEGLRKNASPLPSGEFFAKLADHAKAVSSGEKKQLELVDFFRSELEKGKASLAAPLFVEMASSFIESPDGMRELAVFLEELSLVQGVSQELSKEEFHKLVEFMASLDEETYTELASLEENLLSRRGDCSQSLSYKIDHAVEIRDQMELLTFGTFEEFYSAFFDLNFKYSLYLNVCGQGEFNGQIAGVLAAARNFLGLKGSYSLARSYLLSRNQNSSFEIFRLAGSSFCLKSRKFLKRLRQDGKLRALSNVIYDFLKRFKGRERFPLTSLLRKSAKEIHFFGFVSVFWKKLNFDQQAKFSRYMLLEAPFGANHRATAELFGALHQTYPELISDLNETLRQNPELLEPFLRQLEFFLSDETKTELLKSFLNSRDFDGLLSILSHFPIQAVEDSIQSSASEEPFPVLRNYVLQEGPVACLKKLEAAFENAPGFWDVLPNYPQECHQVFKPTIIKNVFSWTNQIDSKFFHAFERKFSVPYGILSKDMMRFYLSLILVIDHHVEHEDPSYIGGVVQKIKAQLFDHGLLRTLEKGLDVLAFNRSSTQLISTSLMFFSKMSVEDFSSAFGSGFQASNPVDWSIDNTEKTHPRLRTSGGVEAALKLNEELFELLSPEGEGQLLVEALVDFMNPVEGVPLIYGMEEEKFHFDLKNALLFLNELSDEDHVKEIYHFKSGADVELVPMFLSERLENVIVEISFLNNFYGSYFMNKISRSQNYQEEVGSLKKFVKALDMSEGFFRRVGIYPPSTQWAFKNIYNTYDSLEEIGAPSFGPEERAYDKMIQALLSQLVAASKESSRSFSPYRKPNPDVVDGHAGKILSVIAKEKMLTKTSMMLRNTFPRLEKRLAEPDFEELAGKFAALDFNQVKKFLSFFFSSGQAKTVADDVIQLFYSLGGEDRKRLLTVAANFLSSGIRLNAQQLEAGLEIAKSLIGNYDEIKAVYFAKSNMESALPWLEEVSFFAPELSEKFGDLLLVAKDPLVELISDQRFHAAIKDFFEEANLADNRQILIESAEIFSDHRLEMSAFHHMLKEVVEKEGNADYFTQLLLLLSEKDNGRTNLYWALNELLEQKQGLTVQFLEEIISRFRLIKGTQPTSSEKN